MDDDDDDDEANTATGSVELVWNTITPIKAFKDVKVQHKFTDSSWLPEGKTLWGSHFDTSTYDDNKFEKFPSQSDQDDEELLEAWYDRSVGTIQACLANMGIKWAPKEYQPTKFKRNDGRRDRVCTTLTPHTITNMDGPLGYKRLDKLNYTHLPQQKLTKGATCQLCRFLGREEDKLQQVKSNIGYCSDCNVHLCMNCYKPFHCQADILSQGAQHAWRMYLRLRRDENTDSLVGEDCIGYWNHWNFPKEDVRKTKKRKKGNKKAWKKFVRAIIDDK